MRRFFPFLREFRLSRKFRLERHPTTTYAFGRVDTVWGGFCAGVFAFFYYMVRAPFEFYIVPDRLSRVHGFFGFVFGLIGAAFAAVWDVLKSFVVCFDRIGTGFANGCFHQDVLYWFDYSAATSVRDTDALAEQLATTPTPKTWRRDELWTALLIAIAARRTFNLADPHFPKENWHHRVVTMKRFRRVLRRRIPKMEKVLTEKEMAMLLDFMDDLDDEFEMSFSRFCMYLHRAISTRSKAKQDWRRAVSLDLRRDPSFADIYLVSGMSSGVHSSGHQ